MSQKDVYSEVYKYVSQDRVVELAIKFPIGGHSILAYGLVELSDGRYAVLIYDPNHPKETRVLIVNKNSTKPAMYYDASLGSAYVSEVVPIDSITLHIPQINSIVTNSIVTLIDPVHDYTIKTADGQVLDRDQYFSIEKEGYDMIILPKGEYIFELQGDEYSIITLVPSKGGIVAYNLTAKGKFATDKLSIKKDGIEYQTENEKEVILEIGYASQDLKEQGTVKGEVSMKENQAIMVTNPEQAAKGELEVKVDTNGDGKPDKEGVFTNKEESKGTTITQSSKATSATQTVPETSETTTSQKGGICGPAVLVGLAILPLLARRREIES